MYYELSSTNKHFNIWVFLNNMAVVTPPSAVLVQELRKKFNQKLEKEGTKVQGKITINSIKIILSQVCHSLYIYIFSSKSNLNYLL